MTVEPIQGTEKVSVNLETKFEFAKWVIENLRTGKLTPATLEAVGLHTSHFTAEGFAKLKSFNGIPKTKHVLPWLQPELFDAEGNFMLMDGKKSWGLQQPTDWWAEIAESSEPAAEELIVTSPPAQANVAPEQIVEQVLATEMTNPQAPFVAPATVVEASDMLEVGDIEAVIEAIGAKFPGLPAANQMCEDLLELLDGAAPVLSPEDAEKLAILKSARINMLLVKEDAAAEVLRLRIEALEAPVKTVEPTAEQGFFHWVAAGLAVALNHAQTEVAA